MIDIALRLRPFSHHSGTKVVLPGSTKIVTIYPVLLKIDHDEIKIPLTGPVKEFTVELDLERACVKVWGHYSEGFLRYRIHATVDGYTIITEKSPLPHIFPEGSKELFHPQSQERLSLGVHKAQDWDLISRRASLSEILPFWHRLGQLVPESRGVFNCSLENLFLAGFEGILCPHKEDPLHLGIALPPLENPFSLLSEGSRQIRALFFKQEEATIEILPSCSFHAGRFINISCGSYGTLDIEWTKNSLRQMVFRATLSGPLTFCLPRGIKTFRLQKKERLQAGVPLTFNPGVTYLFDRFQ